MKIEHIKAAYSQNSNQVQKPASGNEFSNILTSIEPDEVITRDEKKYFENLFPGMDAESHIQKNYSPNGQSYNVRIGQTIDRKG